MEESDAALRAALAPFVGFGPLDDPAAWTRLEEHGRRVIEAQRRLHLVSDADANDLFARHTADSVALAKCIDADPSWPPAEGLLDIGSGGGFPGLVLAALHPELPVTLVERSAAKAGFLRLTASRMQLERLVVIEGEFPGAVREVKPSLVTARAVERPEAIAKAMARWLPTGAVFWCQSPAMVPTLSGTFHVEHIQGNLFPRAGLWRISRAEVPRGT